MQNNTIEEAKKFIDELKAKGNYCLNYESVAEMLYRYADSRVKKLNKPDVRGSLPADDVDSVIEMLKHHAYGQEEMDECGWDANKMEHLDAFAFDHAIMIHLLGGALEGNDR